MFTLEQIANIKASQSIRVRFLATLVANATRLGFNLLAAMLIARSLGPSDFGNFSFLLCSFAAIIGLLDMGSSQAFYTFISRRKRSVSFYLCYLTWIGIQLSVGVLLLAALIPDAWEDRIWLGHERGLILLAFLVSFTTSQVWQTTTRAGESIRATVLVQIFNICLGAVHLSVVLLMVKFDYLVVTNLFIVILVENLIFVIVLAHRLRNRLTEDNYQHKEGFKQIFGEFKTYCSPLVIFAWASFAYRFAEIWMLQHFGGPVQQGFYSVGLRFSALSLITTTSILQILWKEIAEAGEKQDREKIQRLYVKTSRSLYFVGALMSCFLIPHSREILGTVLGPSFEPAWLCLAVMLLFPLYQSLGQINGTFLYASGNTRTQSHYGIALGALGIVATYFVLAPSTASIGGLGLGADGMALRMVALTAFGVNIQSYLVSRIGGWRFDFWSQPCSLVFLLVNSLVAKTLSFGLLEVLGIAPSLLSCLLSSVPFYLTGAGVLVYIFPWIAGVNKEEFSSISSSARAIIRRGWEYIC